MEMAEIRLMTGEEMAGTDDDRARHLYSDGFASTVRIGPWSVLMEWPAGAEHGPHRIEIRPSVESSPEDVQAGLSSTVLRQIDFGGLQKVADQARELASEATTTWSSVRLREVSGHRVTDEYLARLADVYVNLVRSRESNVTAKLAEITGKAPETIRQHLKRVRKAGLLTTIPGKAGGHLTGKAKDLLEQGRSKPGGTEGL
jgi:DNA-binding transcriptional ArsR family regulator